MDNITKPSITRLARKAGIKSLSDDCFPVIQDIIETLTSEIIDATLVVNSEKNTKTLMVNDIYKAMNIKGYNIAQSSDLGNSTILK